MGIDWQLDGLIGHTQKINDRCQAQMFAPANGKIPVHLCYDFSLRQYVNKTTKEIMYRLKSHGWKTDRRQKMWLAYQF